MLDRPASKTALTWMALAGCSLAAACGQGPAYTGLWSGTAATAGEDTAVVLSITDEAGALAASLTLSEIGVAGWPALAVDETAAGLEIQFPSDSGVQTMRLARDGNHLVGEWREARFDEAARVVLEPHREDASPVEERVVIDGPAGTLGASVVMPAGDGPVPGVVFLHGSGPQPRDANRFAAQALARRGIAAVIFDKRGVGESTGRLNGATFEDLAADAVAAARFLKARERISAVGFFGHSQGGWIGPLAGATWSETAFVISSAGPAVAPRREAQWDVVRQLRTMDAGDDAETDARHAIEVWHQALATGEWQAFDTALDSLRRTSWFDGSGLASFADRPGDEFIGSYTAFMDYDPLPALTGLDAPLLWIGSPDDESIDAAETEQILRGLQEDGHDITLKRYPGYDHTMRRLGANGAPLRFPEHPEGYFDTQVDFITRATHARAVSPP